MRGKITENELRCPCAAFRHGHMQCIHTDRQPGHWRCYRRAAAVLTAAPLGTKGQERRSMHLYARDCLSNQAQTEEAIHVRSTDTPLQCEISTKDSMKIPKIVTAADMAAPLAMVRPMISKRRRTKCLLTCVCGTLVYLMVRQGCD